MLQIFITFVVLLRLQALLHWQALHTRFVPLNKMKLSMIDPQYGFEG